MTDFVSQREFRRLAAAGQARGVGVAHPAKLERILDDGDRVVRFVFSDSSIDRMGDRISVSGWDLAAYRSNPTVLWSHDAMLPPIGRTLRVFPEGQRLLGDVEFADASVNEFADSIYKMVRAGFIQSGSVGFLPTKYKYSDRGSGIDFLEQELLEYSMTNVPANPNALIAAKKLGIPRHDLARLGWTGRSNVIDYPRKRVSLAQAEALRRVAGYRFDRSTSSGLRGFLAELKRIGTMIS
jgi:HK97 family phage prohead protease